MFVFGIVLLLMGSLLPSLQVSYTQARNLGSFPLMGVLTATVLVGPILDIVGAKPVLGWALVLTASALGAMPSLHSYLGLAGAALAYGVGGGLLNTATNALVSDLNASGRGAALNLLGFSFSLGAISAPLLMSSIGASLPSSAVLHPYLGHRGPKVRRERWMAKRIVHSALAADRATISVRVGKKRENGRSWLTILEPSLRIPRWLES